MTWNLREELPVLRTSTFMSQSLMAAGAARVEPNGPVRAAPAARLILPIPPRAWAGSPA